MEENELQFLTFVSRNAQMGVDSIKQLVDIVENENFKSMLKKQYNEYKKILEQSKNIIEKNNKSASSTNVIQKAETYLMISVQTLLDKSADNIAGMLMKGSVMGIIQIIRRIKQYASKISEETLSLGERLRKIEESNLEECKKFLGEK